MMKVKHLALAGALTLGAALTPLSSASAQRFCTDQPQTPGDPVEDPEKGCDIGGPIGTGDPTSPNGAAGEDTANDELALLVDAAIKGAQE